MRVSARFVKGIALSLIVFFLTTLIFPTVSSAQTQSQTTTQNTLSPTPSVAVNPYTKPYTDDAVPQNQHILTQALFIEVLGALGCQLAGIDLISPSQPCLGVNPQTEKLGFAIPPAPDGQPQIGGLLGVAANGVGIMFTPTYGTNEYVHYMAGNFGITKSAYAAEGFVALTPILRLWEASRNIAYFLLTIAFIFIGIGVMLRLKIDPRTVMTVQNRIPDVIIAIILITFSYAISGLMVDLMWTTTYVGINTITAYGANPQIPNCSNDTTPTLRSYATNNLTSSPFTFVNQIFLTEVCGFGESDTFDSGIFDLARKVGYEVAGLERDLILQFIGVDPSRGGCSIGDWVLDTGSLQFECPRIWFGNIFGFFASILWFIIIFIVIIITLFRIWFELLKAYVVTLLYVILGPIYIVMGLLPKKPLGFEKWLRVSFANLAVFPATVALLVLARAFMFLFDSSTTTAAATDSSWGVVSQVFAQTPGTAERFVPPLVGAPNAQGFGAVLGFAILLMTPQLTSLLREKLGVQPVKQVSAALGTVTAGTGAVGGVARKTWGGLNRRNPTTGAAEAPISRLFERGKIGIATTAANMRLPGASSWEERLQSRRSGRGYTTAEERGETSRRQARGPAPATSPARGPVAVQQPAPAQQQAFKAAQQAAQARRGTPRYTDDADGLQRFDLERRHGEMNVRLNNPATPADEKARLIPAVAQLSAAIRELGTKGLHISEATPPQGGQPTPPAGETRRTGLIIPNEPERRTRPPGESSGNT